MLCSEPKGVSTCRPLWVLRVYHRITITGSRFQRLLSFACFLLLPVNGSMYSLREIWSLSKSSSNWFWIYSWIIFAFSLPYPQSIYGTRNSCSRIYISDLRANRRSSVHFCSLSVPTNCTILMYGEILTNR